MEDKSKELEKVRNFVLSTAYICGLTRVDEAISNIDRYAMSVYSYKEIPDRLREIYEAFAGIEGSELVVDLLGPEEVKRIDDELSSIMRDESE